MFKNKKGQEAIVGWMVAIAIMAVIFTFIIGFKVVDYNEYAYVQRFGKLSKDLKEPGIRIVPFASLKRLNNQIETYNFQLDASSVDRQSVNFDVNMNIQLREEKSYDFLVDYKNKDVFIQYLQNKIQTRAKAVLFEYNAEDLLSNRAEIEKAVFDGVKEIEGIDYFEIKDFSLSNIDYTDEFDAILEKKAQVEIQRDIIEMEKENFELINKNLAILDVDSYLKYQIAEKYNGNAALYMGGLMVQE